MCQVSLTLLGLWPDLKKSKYGAATSLFRFILITSIIVVYVNTAQTCKLVMIWGDLDTMTDNISTANLPIAVAVFKMLIFFHNRRGNHYSTYFV